MARDAGLRQTEDAGQLVDVEAVPGQDAQQAEAGFVAEQPVEGRGLLHIH